MLDAGIVMPWDPRLGKYVFKLVRDPGADPVLTLPALAIAAPQAEIEVVLDAGMPDRKIYMFKDRDLNYLDAPANSTDDDGRSSRTDRQNVTKENIRIATDLETANQIASRREQYEISPPSSYTIEALRAARALTPGTPIDVEGIDERLRIGEVGPINANSPKVTVKALTDIYIAPGPTPE